MLPKHRHASAAFAVTSFERLRAAMLDLANDIRSLSDFKRSTADLLERLRRRVIHWG